MSPQNNNNFPLENNTISQTSVAHAFPRGYVYLFVLTSLLFFTGVFGVWYFSQLLPEEISEVESLKNQPQNLKTYIRDKYLGIFEFKYPRNWSVFEYDNSVNLYKNGSTDFISFEISPFASIPKISSLDQSISFLKKNTGTDLVESSEIKIEKGDAFYFTNDETQLGNGNGPKSSEAYLASNNTVYKIVYDGGTSKVTLGEREKTMLGILSTFKFISTSTSVKSSIQFQVSAGEWTMIEETISKKFNSSNREVVADGCSLDRVTKIKKEVNGYTVDIEYACGFVLAGATLLKATVFVSNSKEVIGIPVKY